MTNYNGEKYIGQAIDSVVSQDHEDFELLIVDDASTDGSRKVIDERCLQYSDRVKTFYMKSNQGQAACINHAINHIEGDIASFIDSDDYWLPGKLVSVSEVFSGKKSAAIFQHNLYLMKDNLVTDQNICDILVEGNYFEYVMKNSSIYADMDLAFPRFVPTTGLSFRVEHLKKVLPIPVEFRVCADGYLTRTAFCWGEVVSDTDCFGVYRVHGENNTYGNSKYNEKKYLNTILHPALDRYYRENNIALSFRRSIFRKLINTSPARILRQYFRLKV